MKNLLKKWNQLSLVKRIIIGLIIGIILAVTIPDTARPVTVLGSLFVGALKAVAPVLVLFLVVNAISRHKKGQRTNMKSIIVLYLIGTFLSAFTAVAASFIFPVGLTLTETAENLNPPGGVTDVILSLLLNIVDNPVKAVSNANYIGILAWAIIMGLALKNAADSSKDLISNISDALSKAVVWVINFAPLGIMGLVFESVSTSGLNVLLGYGQLLLLLIGCMIFVALIINPIIVFLNTRKNPYPLVFTCLKDSGITAFFTRSSAANIPVNMKLCEKLGLDKNTYSISIPLGAFL